MQSLMMSAIIAGGLTILLDATGAELSTVGVITWIIGWTFGHAFN